MAGLEEQLAAAEEKAETVQADKERLLNMVSRLELEKHRLQTGRSSGSNSGTPAPMTPGYAGSSTR